MLGDNRSIELAQNVYEGVLGVNNKAQIVPELASTWSAAANGLVYTFHLRHGLQFENGDPITASDFVYTFNRSLSPKTAAGASFFLADIKGANAVLNGKAEERERDQGDRQVHASGDPCAQGGLLRG